LLTLAITNIIEQESLDVSIFGSADGATWDPKPVAAFPQKFYREEIPLLLNLMARPEIKFVRAHWEVGRWGRGTETPMFEFHVTLREVPQNSSPKLPGGCAGRRNFRGKRSDCRGENRQSCLCTLTSAI